jgi:hypothetical protein
MHCKKCDAVFHMDSNGRIVLGEPPRPGEKPKSRTGGRARQTKSTNPDISPIKLMQSVPKPVWITLGAILLLVFIIRNVNFNPPPESPLLKLQDIVKAAVNGDKSTLGSLSIGSTGPDAEKWSEKIRTVGRLAGPYEEVLAAPDLRNMDESGQSQFYTVKFMKLKDSSGHEVPLNIGLYMVLSRGRWYLDGTSTLRDADKTTSIEPPKR